MLQHRHVHIVDSEAHRRASIARQLYGRGIHAEIYETLDELIERAPRTGCVLINTDCPASDEEQSIGRIASLADVLPLAFFAAAPCPERIVPAVLAGALDYLQWPCATELLVFKLERLARIGSERVADQQRKREAKALVAALSPRERDVLGCVLAGGSNKQIGAWLGISPRTVEIHRGNMMSRLNARSAAEAVRIGIDAGLLDRTDERANPLARLELEVAA